MKKYFPKFLVEPGSEVKLADYNPAYTNDFAEEDEAEERLKDDIKKLYKLQEKLYASGRQSLLIILQAMDAAGKDSTIKHVMSGLNPQGCTVTSFKHPSIEENSHDFLWRYGKALPEKGSIGIFNRSHYENVLICRVHPELVLAEKVPGINTLEDITGDFWKNRYKQIRKFEKNIVQNGTKILKFFLHLSKNEQRKRFLERIDNPEKHWKFNFADINERSYWDEYHDAYEKAMEATSTRHAPWYIIPADKKWFTRVIIANIIRHTLEDMELDFPELPEKEKARLEKAKTSLLAEGKRKS